MDELKASVKEMAKAIKQLTVHKAPHVPFRREPFPRRDWDRVANSNGEYRNDNQRNWRGNYDHGHGGNQQRQKTYYNDNWKKNSSGEEKNWQRREYTRTPMNSPTPGRDDTEQVQSAQQESEQQRSFSTRTNTGQIRCRVCSGPHYAKFCPENMPVPQNSVNSLEVQEQEDMIKNFGTINSLAEAFLSESPFRGKMIKIQALVDGFPVTGIVDTGSTATCLSSTLAKTLGLKVDTFIGPKLAAVNGENVQPDGQATVFITVSDGEGEATLKLPVLILGKLNMDILLGNDFNIPANVVVDCAEQRIILASKLDLEVKRKKIKLEKKKPSSEYMNLMDKYSDLSNTTYEDDDLMDYPRGINMLSQEVNEPEFKKPKRPDRLPVGRTRMFLISQEYIRIPPGAQIELHVETLDFIPANGTIYIVTQADSELEVERHGVTFHHTETKLMVCNNKPSVLEIKLGAPVALIEEFYPQRPDWNLVSDDPRSPVPVHVVRPTFYHGTPPLPKTNIYSTETLELRRGESKLIWVDIDCRETLHEIDYFQIEKLDKGITVLPEIFMVEMHKKTALRVKNDETGLVQLFENSLIAKAKKFSFAELDEFAVTSGLGDFALLDVQLRATTMRSELETLEEARDETARNEMAINMLQVQGPIVNSRSFEFNLDEMVKYLDALDEPDYVNQHEYEQVGGSFVENIYDTILDKLAALKLEHQTELKNSEIVLRTQETAEPCTDLVLDEEAGQQEKTAKLEATKAVEYRVRLKGVPSIQLGLLFVLLIVLMVARLTEAAPADGAMTIMDMTGIIRIIGYLLMFAGFLLLWYYIVRKLINIHLTHLQSRIEVSNLTAEELETRVPVDEFQENGLGQGIGEHKFETREKRKTRTQEFITEVSRYFHF
ncbi:hypothetical protein HDE_12637 [Halotydeus destructor]|nr:hypothetical protein HDE_12637 [Halotydeus destructor]